VNIVPRFNDDTVMPPSVAAVDDDDDDDVDDGSLCRQLSAVLI